MILQDIINLTIDRLDLKFDTDIENVLIASINEGYMKLNKVNPRVITSYIPIINKVATLPDTLIKIISCSPAITEDDIQMGSNIITSKTGTFEIVHTSLYEPLEDLDSEPELPTYLHSILSTYACYKFMQNKNPNVSQGYLTEFEMARTDYEDNIKKSNNSTNSIQNYYSEFNLVGEW